MGDHGFRSNTPENLQFKKKKQVLNVAAGIFRPSGGFGGAAHSDVLNTGVPSVHLLHSDKQDVVEFIPTGLQDRLEPEHLSGTGHHFAADHVPVVLQAKKTRRRVCNSRVHSECEHHSRDAGHRATSVISTFHPSLFSNILSAFIMASWPCLT